MFAKLRQLMFGLLILVFLTNPVSVVQARVTDQDLSLTPVATDPISTATSNPATDTPLPDFTPTSTPQPTLVENPTSTPVNTEAPTNLPPTAVFTTTSLPSPVPTSTTTPTTKPISTIAQSAINAVPSRATHYYLADRVINNADFAKLAGWGVNTAIVDFDVNGSASTWRTVFTSASAAKINVVIWPSDWNNPRPNCGWEAPYPVTATGDITKVKNLLDVASQYPNFIGIVNAHESFWSCTNMTFDEMAGLKTQLKAYALSKGRNIKVWNYIDNLYDKSMFPDNQIERIMDVAVTWQHCAGNVEGTCNTTSSTSALNMILSDRNRIANSGAQVELVYLMQTFTTGGYTTKFTLSQLQDYSCQFLNTSALDGFGFYTWDAGWWSDLHSWPELQPAVQYVKSCTNSSDIPTSTALPPTSTQTSTPPTMTNTASPTKTPAPSTSTGFLSPSANAAQTSSAGDNNGYQTSPANAYANDSLVTTDTNSGTNTNTSCTNNGKDKHRYYNYNLNIPATAVIKGIQVRLDARADATSGSPKICVQLSWDGGTTWTTAKSTTTLSTTEATYTLGSISDTWGRTWISSNFSNANFRIRVIDVASNTRRDFFLDYVAVNVTYQP